MSNYSHDEIREIIIENLGYPDFSEADKAVTILSQIPDDDLVAAFENLLEDPDAPLALGIARAIGELNCLEAGNLVTKLIDEPGKWFGHADRNAIQKAAIYSAGQLRLRDALDTLLYVVKKSHNPDVLMEAVNAIGRLGLEDAIEPLLKEIGSNPEVALSAAGAIAEIGGKSALQGLLDCLTSTNEMVVSAAIWALGKLGNPEAIRPLISLLRFCEPDLRADIAWAIGRIGGIRARITLAAMSQGDDDLGVRREASRAIRSGAILGTDTAKNRD